MSSSYQQGCTKLEISFSQLLTMLNMVSDEHIDETTALSMLIELGVATPRPLSLVPPPLQTRSTVSSPPESDLSSLVTGFQRSVTVRDPATRRGPLSPVSSTTSTSRSPGIPPPGSLQEGRGSSRAACPLPIPNPSSAFADQGEPSNSKTPVGQIPADIRWYTVTCGERIGAVQGWNRAESLVCNVSGGRQTLAKGKEDARKRFFDAVLDPMVKVRSVSGKVVGIPGITTITNLVNWAEAEAGHRRRRSRESSESN